MRVVKQLHVQKQFSRKSIASKSNCQKPSSKRPMSAKPNSFSQNVQNSRQGLQNKLVELGLKASMPSQVQIIDEKEEFSTPNNRESVLQIEQKERQISPNQSQSQMFMIQSQTNQHSHNQFSIISEKDQLRYGIKSCYECRRDIDKKHPQQRPQSALIMAIQNDIHPNLVSQDLIQNATQTQEWRALIQQTIDQEKLTNINRVWSSNQLRKNHEIQDKKSEQLPEEYLKQVFFKKQNQKEILGSQCPKIVHAPAFQPFSRTLNNSTSQNQLNKIYGNPQVTETGKINKKAKLDSTSMLWQPKLTAANSKKALRTSQSMTSIKYKSNGFEHFERQLQMPAKKKIEYFKLHKQIHECKVDQKKMIEQENINKERLMPIYSKEDLIQIKNGNVQTVLQFNAITRPQSASSRVLLKETDPLNNLKRKYYRNSNKLLGNQENQNDLFSKRNQTTIKELNTDLKDRGMLSDEKQKSKSMGITRMKFGDKNNSMLKSDIDIDEDRDNIIIELDDDEEGDKTQIIEQVQQVQNAKKDYEITRGAPSFMDSAQDNSEQQSLMQNSDIRSTNLIIQNSSNKFQTRPFSAVVQRNQNQAPQLNFKNQDIAHETIPESDQDSEIRVNEIVNIKTMKYMMRPQTSKMAHFRKITSAKRKPLRGSSSMTRLTQLSTTDDNYSQQQQFQQMSMQNLHQAKDNPNNGFENFSTQPVSKNLQQSQITESSAGNSKILSPTLQNLMLPFGSSHSIQSNNQNQNINQPLYSHKALRNKDIRINANFNYQYHKNKQMIMAQQQNQNNYLNKYQRLNPSQSMKQFLNNIPQPTYQLQTPTSNQINFTMTNNKQQSNNQTSLEYSQSNTMFYNTQNNQILQQYLTFNQQQSEQINNQQQNVAPFTENNIQQNNQVINDQSLNIVEKREDDDEFQRQMSKAQNLKPVFTQRTMMRVHNGQSQSHFRPMTAGQRVQQVSHKTGTENTSSQNNASSNKKSHNDLQKESSQRITPSKEDQHLNPSQNSQQHSPRSQNHLKPAVLMEDAQVQLSTMRTQMQNNNNNDFNQQYHSNGQYFNQYISQQDGQQPKLSTFKKNTQQPKVSIKYAQKNKNLLMSQTNKNLYKANMMRSNSQSQFQNDQNIEIGLNEQHPFIQQSQQQQQQIVQSEIIYPIRGNSRTRPISAAINKKAHKGFYSTVDLKFVASNQGVNDQKQMSRNQQQRSQLLQFIGQDYQGLQRTSHLAIPDAIIQRQAMNSNPLVTGGPIPNSKLNQMDQINLANNHEILESEVPQFSNEMFYRRSSIEQEYEEDIKYVKPSVATLNCYVKLGSPTKMLMIGPQITD
eukprot:403348604